MDKYLYVVTPQKNEQEVKAVFRNYLNVPNVSTLLKLLYTTLAFSISKTPILKIEMCVDKIPFIALYKDGRITFSERLIKKASDIYVLPELLDSTFHELSHALMQINNAYILQTKKCPENYKPVFDLEAINEILEEISDDSEFARGGALYYYNKNINEITARKTANTLCKKYLNHFASEQGFIVPSFEEREQKTVSDLLKQYPFLETSANRVEDMITTYQKKLITKGVDKLNEQEIKKLIASINVHLAPDTKVMLVISCARCNDIEKANNILSTPMVKISKDELSILSGAYQELVLQHILFFEDDVPLVVDR